MIPKVIHYCWFGRNPLPKDARRCIESWRRYMPGYEIKEWNEDNFDIDSCAYVRQAYDAGKYAFVSDYARFKVLYDHGGLYFDTDVELLRPIDNLVAEGNFMGIEKSLATNGADPDAQVCVAPGLGIASAPGMPLFSELLDMYGQMQFDIAAGTVVTLTTNVLIGHGLANSNIKQQVAGFTIYPDDVLCPMDSTTGIVTLTPNTVAIHHYSCSWIDHNTLSWRLHELKNKLIKLLGPRLVLALTRRRR